MENIVYTISYCPYCVRVKALLEKEGVDFKEVQVSDHGRMMELKDQFGFRTFPMVVLNGKFVGGFEDTRALIEAGRLEDVLDGAGAE